MILSPFVVAGIFHFANRALCASAYIRQYFSCCGVRSHVSVPQGCYHLAVYDGAQTGDSTAVILLMSKRTSEESETVTHQGVNLCDGKILKAFNEFTGRQFDGRFSCLKTYF